MADNLIAPHGGELVDGLVSDSRKLELQQASSAWPSWDLTPRQLCDLELILGGAFSPLRGFMARRDYESVCESMRLADGTLWPMPIVLDVDERLGSELGPGQTLALRDAEGVMLAAMRIEDVWRPDLPAEAERVFGADRSRPWYVGGRLEGLQLPVHWDFRELRYTPAKLRREFGRLGWRRIIAFQTRDVMHRSQHAMTLHAAREVEANLLIHPVVGLTSPGDLDHYTRVHCYEKVLAHYPHHAAKLALLPLADRPAGARDALWQAIVQKNYGCTHVIVDGERTGDPAGADASRELLREHAPELGVETVPFRSMVYVEDEATYRPRDEVGARARVRTLAPAELERRLAKGRAIPDWFTFPEVAAQLRRRHPPRHRQGFTLFFTGLSGAGKSTIANALLVKFLELDGRPVTLLDGDIVRKHLSSELGFSREHRDINIRRIGFVASEITKNGGIAICAPIAPYDRVRKELRAMIEAVGGFILVHVDAPLAVCEQRDRKGLYAKARAGKIKEFTGISDPYEEPADADVTLSTTDLTPEQAAQEVLLHLEHEGYVGVNGER